MPKYERQIKSIGGVFSRKDTIKVISDNLNGISTELIDDILNETFSQDTFNRIRKGDEFTVPGYFKLRIPISHFKKIEKKKAKTAARTKAQRKLNPRIRACIQKHKNKYCSYYWHNKWREINGLKPVKRRIRKNTLLFRSMPSVEKMRKLYPEYFNRQNNTK